MKKIILILILLSALGCKVKQIDTLSKEDKVENVSETKTDTSYVKEYVVKETEESLTKEEVVSIINSLSVSYDGKELSDKMDILLHKDSLGTKVTFSGIGKANYKEDYKKDLKQLQEILIRRQDSLFSNLLKEVSYKNEQLLKESYIKEKDVKVTGFQFGFYITAFFIIVVIVALLLIYLKFRK